MADHLQGRLGMTDLFSIQWLRIFTTACCLYLFSSLYSNESFALSNNAESIDYPKILREQRTWAGLSSKTLRVGDVVWSYSEGGKKDRPTILLIHGLSSNRDTWNVIAHELTPYYHVIIPDLPNNGETRVANNFDLSVPNVAEQLRRFVEAANIQNHLNVVGHSMGGSIAMFYASQYAFDTQSLFFTTFKPLFRSKWQL